MRILVTGSAGHLGEALMRTLREHHPQHDALGIDVLPSSHTDRVGSIADRAFVHACMAGVDAVLHAATLHKPHVATHTRQDFVDTNVSGTLNLLEEAVAAGVRAFVYTSTTSAFGRALVPPEGEPAAWITEDVVPVPKNIYGATKVAAEDLCELVQRDHGLPCIVLRTSRFFPEGDDDEHARAAYAGDNLKVSEFLHRRVDIEDVVDAHLLAIERAAAIGFARYIISATTPFTRHDLPALRRDATGVVRHRVPGYEAVYQRLRWTMLPTIDRVYVNERARMQLGWRPRHDFAAVIARLAAGDDDFRSPLARVVGAKGYHRKPPSD
jgi:UDP-glucose 4-epimerase